jgi:thiosulfate/3-mercaptopyruvate sulfurtransferase
MMSVNYNQSPLISVAELNALLSNENVKVFDIRGKWEDPPASYAKDYEEAHIPGAIYLDWTRYFLTQGMPIGQAPVAPKEQAQEDFKQLGISANDTVVLYDDYHHMLSGRVWWAMRYWGFTNVRVLNGGWKHWLNDGLRTSQAIATPKQGSFTVNEQPQLLADIEDVRDRNDDTHVIDARGPINYTGKPEDPRTGHIPGALNVPYSSLLDAETGLFKDKETLRELLATHFDLTSEMNFISSCGSGYAGTVFLLAMKLIGIDAPLYDGSFSEWKSYNNLPIEQGSAAFAVE